MANGSDSNMRFGFVVYDVARLLREQFRTTAPEFGLTLAQGRALIHLSRNEGISQVALSAILEVQPITLLRHLDRLESAGLIERRAHPSDRRVQQLYLTQRSHQLLRKISDMTVEAHERVMAGLSHAEREQLVASLERVKANLIEMTASSLTDAAPAGAKRRRRVVS